MLSNTLVIPVLLDSTPENVEFRRFEENSNRTVYIGPEHQLDSKQVLIVSRSLPKKSGNFRGNLTTEVRIFDDVTIKAADGSDLSVPGSITITAVLPVGCNAEYVHRLIDYGRSALAHSEVRTKLIPLGEV